MLLINYLETTLKKNVELITKREKILTKAMILSKQLGDFKVVVLNSKLFIAIAILLLKQLHKKMLKLELIGCVFYLI